MKLSISGRPLSMGVNQILLHQALNYYGSILMKEDSSRLDGIVVEVHLIPNMREDTKNDACCGWIDDRIRPNKFYIDLDSNLSHKGILIATAHEFTHIKQMAMGERTETLDGRFIRWFGMVVDPSTLHYYDLPWEIEAHGREFGLYDRFVQSQRGELLEPAKFVDIEQRLSVVA